MSIKLKYNIREKLLIIINRFNDYTVMEDNVLCYAQVPIV